MDAGKIEEGWLVGSIRRGNSLDRETSGFVLSAHRVGRKRKSKVRWTLREAGALIRLDQQEKIECQLPSDLLLSLFLSTPVFRQGLSSCQRSCLSLNQCSITRTCILSMISNFDNLLSVSNVRKLLKIVSYSSIYRPCSNI